MDAFTDPKKASPELRALAELPAGLRLMFHTPEKSLQEGETRNAPRTQDLLSGEERDENGPPG